MGGGGLVKFAPGRSAGGTEEGCGQTGRKRERQQAPRHKSKTRPPSTTQPPQLHAPQAFHASGLPRPRVVLTIHNLDNTGEVMTRCDDRDDGSDDDSRVCPWCSAVYCCYGVAAAAAAGRLCVPAWWGPFALRAPPACIARRSRSLKRRAHPSHPYTHKTPRIINIIATITIRCARTSSPSPASPARRLRASTAPSTSARSATTRSASTS